MDRRNPRSTAQYKGHPIHPMLVPFPIAFLVAALFADLAFWWTGSPGWATAGLWLLGAGVVTGALAAAAGLIDFVGEPRIRHLTDAWHHFLGNAIAIVLALFNWIWRLQGGEAAVLPWGLIFSLMVVLILLFTGWKGGEMVYRHRVGVADPAEPLDHP